MVVTIHLRPLTTSLIITVINAIVELVSLSAMLVMIAAHECRTLRKGKAISIRRHSLYVKLVSLAAMIMFIVLETLISNYSDAASVTTNKEQDCIRTKAGMVSGKDFSASEGITLKCMKIADDVYSFRAGNYSKSTTTVQCEKDVVYTYRTDDILNDEPISDAIIKCVSPNCVAVKYKDDQVLISQPFSEETLEDLESAFAWFLRTNTTSRPSIEEIANKVADLYNTTITDEFEIRRLAFLRAQEGRCAFVDERKQITKISTWIAVIVLLVWVLSIFLSLGSLVVKKYVFYDLCQAWDWAAKTHNVPERGTSNDFYVKCRIGDGFDRIYVTGSPDENEGLCDV